MPELIEVEQYRRLADTCVGLVIAAVDAPDPWYLKGGIDAVQINAALIGRSFEATRRVGKVLLVDLDDGAVMSLRFGMTGRLFVDDAPGVDELRYSPTRIDPKWDRFTIRFEQGRTLRMQDPRRLGGVALDMNEEALGPDARDITVAELTRALRDSVVPLKARLMDQRRVAGVGNLLADELLWRAGYDPARPASSLSPSQVRRLHRVLRVTLEDLLERGGSHLGDLQ